MDTGDVSSRVVTYESALHHATRLFVSTSTVDLAALASSLSVSRATLYRVLSGRDRLIADLLWKAAERSMRAAFAEATGCGVDRFVSAGNRHLRELVAWQPFTTFVTRERDTAHRVLFGSRGSVHERSVVLWAELLQGAADAGSVRLRFAAADVAHLVVSVTQSVVYKDLLEGNAPDLELAMVAQRALLHSLTEDLEQSPDSGTRGPLLPDRT